MTFKPMLAVDATDALDKLRYPLVASPKLDGIRCLTGWHGKVLSRSLKPIPNKGIVQSLGGMSLDGLDGELMVPGATFQQVTSRVMGRDADGPWQYHVFDRHDLDPRVPFTERFASARAAVESAYFKDIVKLVPHTLIQDAEELTKYEAEQLALGYEGVMLRDPNGPYKHGRSTLREGWLLKLKRFEDAEATIVGFEEEMANDNEAFTSELGRTKRSSAKAGKRGKGTLGAFVLCSPEWLCPTCASRYAKWECPICHGLPGLPFSCGGFTQAQKDDFWARRVELVGKFVTYKFQRHGSKDAPRSPVFKGLRDARDM